MSEYLVVTGMSGAGRSTAGATLEDLGWFVIDNMPSALISKVSELVRGSELEHVAFVVGRGGGDIDDVMPAIEALRSGRDRVRMALPRCRRRHPDPPVRGHTAAPPAGRPGRGGLDRRGRAPAQPLREHADLVIDTGELNVNQLRSRLMEVFGGEDTDATMQTSILSFGFKHGVPLDVDLMFDCRFLPNPYWESPFAPRAGWTSPCGTTCSDGPRPPRSWTSWTTC